MVNLWNRYAAKITIWAVAFCVLVAVGGDVLIYCAPSLPYGYAWKHNVALSQVVVAKRAYDCEWSSAPLGAKHCHYETSVEVTKTAVATDGVTPLVSHDGGKTWTTNTLQFEPSVYVLWVKVAD